MKQSRKRGTQAVLDFKQSLLQGYLADRKPVIDTLVRNLRKENAMGRSSDLVLSLFLSLSLQKEKKEIGKKRKGKKSLAESK
jgi:hypothetical protein